MSDHEPIHPTADASARLSILRYKWLLALAFLVGAPGAYVAWTNVDASYTAEGNLWIVSPSSQGSNEVPTARAAGLAQANAWVELLRSYRVLEPVVMEHTLHLQASEEHAPAFASFTVAEQFRPGAYELRVGAAAEDFILVSDEGALVQQGSFGTPIGENVGFSWTPARGSFAPGANVGFSVLSPRDAARALSDRLVTRMDRAGNFLGLQLSGPDPQKIADVLNSLMERHVDLAAELKSSKLDETLAVLEEQLQAIELELAQAERDLEGFRLRQEESAETIEEARLRRRIQTAETLYTDVRLQVETARRAAATSTPDVRILDSATVPQRPSEDRRLPIAAAILFGCIAAAAGGALMLGRRDVRSRYAAGEVAALHLREDLVPVVAIIVGCLLAVIATLSM